MAIKNAGTAVLSEAAITEAKSRFTVHPNYQIQLHVTNDTTLDSEGRRIFPIVAFLPEKFNIQFSSQYNTPFARSLSDIIAKVGGEVAGALSATAAAAAGIGTKLKSTTIQMWEESSPLTFSVDFVFQAITNTIADVQDKHRALLKLCAPSLGPDGQTLHSPGPTVFSEVMNGRTITLQIGSYLRMSPVIVKSVSSDVDTILDKNGIPMSMSVNVQIESLYSCFTTQDIDQMFLQR